jgi:hypothetical protein
MGLGCAAMLIATGIVLTLTGVGAIIGIPLLLFGVVFPFIAPLFGLFTVEQRNVSKDEENRNLSVRLCRDIKVLH